jgi:hypothetical protein
VLVRKWAMALIIVVTSMGAAAHSNSVDAVRPGAQGVLTKRIDWLVASSRRTYHHIRLPARVAVGDTITFSFGSSPKTYRFSVARIIMKGNRCEIFSESEIHHHRDKISVTPCYPIGNEQ